MKKGKVKALRNKLSKIITDPTKQQWRAFKRNFKRGLV
jgi:hypothetical protein